MKTLPLLAIALIIVILTACGGDTPASQPAQPTSAPGVTSTPVPAPTRPQRIQGLGATPTQPAPTSQAPGSTLPPRPVDTTPRPLPQQTAPADTATPAPGSTPADDIPIEALIPENPQTDDTVLLQDIYAYVDLDQFALDPKAPIDLPPTAVYRDNPASMTMDQLKRHLPAHLPQGERDPTIYRQPFPYEAIKDHPYLHVFPELETAVHQNSKRGNGPLSQVNYPSERYSKGGTANGIAHFIRQPWFETSSSDQLWFGNNSTRTVLLQAVTQALEDAKYPATQRFPSFWLGRELKYWDLSAYLSRPFRYNRGVYNIPLRGTHETPITHWELVHPQLPIIKITSYTSTILPLITGYPELDEMSPETLIKGIELFNDYSDKRRIQTRRITELTTEQILQRRLNETPAESLEEIRFFAAIPPPTIFATSFVISFQHRWTSFDEPNRRFNRFRDQITPSCHPPGAIHCLFPNYWHTTDYMQHRIIGPVVVQVYESEVIQPGIYSATPRMTEWEAPEYVLPQSVLTKLTEMEAPRLRYYPDQAIENWWEEEGKAYWFEHNRLHNFPDPNFPLPGHVLAYLESEGPGTEIWEHYEMDANDW